VIHEYYEEKENELIQDYKNVRRNGKEKPPLTSPATRVNGG
jgi:hypothetical protein